MLMEARGCLTVHDCPPQNTDEESPWLVLKCLLEPNRTVQSLWRALRSMRPSMQGLPQMRVIPGALCPQLGPYLRNALRLGPSLSITFGVALAGPSTFLCFKTRLSLT